MAPAFFDDIEKESLAEKTQKNPEKTPKNSEKNEQKIEEITIDDFARVQLRVGKVLKCEKVEGSDKLLKSTVLCDRERTIVSGIAKWYTPQEMVGRQVVVVTNLRPVKLRGVLSEGMILCAEDETGALALVSPEKVINAGAEVR